jgi:putative ABC transport system permease protein
MIVQHATIKLAFRNLSTRKLRTLLTLMGIVLGVAVVLAINITNDSTLDSIRTVFDEASGKAHLVITDDSALPEAFSISVLKQVQRMSGVVAAAPSVNKSTLTVKQAREWGLSLSVVGASAANDILVMGVQPDLDQAVRDYNIVAGEWLPEKERRAYKTLLVKDYADEQGYQVGNDLEILLEGGVKESLEIIGLIAKQGPGLQNEGAVMVVPLDTAQRLFNLSSDIDQIDVILEPAIAENAKALEEAKNVMQAKLGNDYSVLFPASRGDVAAKQLEGYQVGLSFFSAIALFVGAFLIYNTFTMTVVERTREIGMLRTLGMQRHQIGGLVLTEALLLGTLGSLLGVGFGVVLARGLMRSVRVISGSEALAMSIPLDGLGWSLLVGLGVTLVSALLPAIKASQISPLEALRITATPPEPLLGRSGWIVGLQLILLAYAALYLIPIPDTIETSVGFASVFILLLGATLVVPITIGPLERTIRPIVTSAYKGEGRLGASNVRRARARTALTVAALMVGIAMIIGIQTMTRSFETDIDHWVATAIGGDLYVRSPQPMREEFGTRLLDEEAVVAISPVTYYRTRHVPPDGDPEKTDTVLWVGIDPVTYPTVGSYVFADPTIDQAAVLARIARGGAVIVSTTLADRYHLDQGDTITLETRRGHQTFEIVGVVIDFSSQGFTIQGSRADVERFFGRRKVDLFILKLKDGVDAPTMAELLEERHGKTHHIVVETTQDFRQRVNEVSRQAFALFDVLGMIGVIIAALGVINTLLMNVFERQQEIGGLRSLGMTRRQVRRMILAESGTMGFIGGVFGIAFGLALSRIFLLGVQGIAGYTLNYHLPPESLLISAAIALLVSQVAAFYPAWKASRVRIVEAIQHE